MLQSAAQTVRECRAQRRGVTTRLLAVTILTSLDDADLRQIGIDHSVSGEVLNLARLARSAGIEGIVASPQEVQHLRAEHGRALVLVTPGVRLDPSRSHDQKRVSTPASAIREGSDFLVMGRSLLESADPPATLERVLQEIRP